MYFTSTISTALKWFSSDLLLLLHLKHTSEEFCISLPSFSPKFPSFFLGTCRCYCCIKYLKRVPNLFLKLVYFHFLDN